MPDRARRLAARLADRLGVTRRVHLDRARAELAELAAAIARLQDDTRRSGDEIDLLRRADRWVTADPLPDTGVNVVGYLHHQLGLGELARRLVAVLRHGGVPCSPIAYGLVPAPAVADPPPVEQRIAFADSIALLPADQIGLLGWLHPELRAASRRLVGYCYWELETLSEPMRRGVEQVDEIWVHTRFVEEAFASGTDRPVHRVPLPLPEPVVSSRTRTDFPVLAPIGDRCLLGVAFDYFSVFERKHPLGAVAAFERAFAPDEGPVLVVKTLNAERFPDQHARLLAASERRPDVIVWDEQLPRADQMAFVAALDGLVSLHRSEGLGAHLAEAMWLGTPVVATRYSGNLDLMDDTNSLLVGHAMVPVADGGGIYPPGAMWADPDIDHAAEHLRALVGDDALRARLAAAARATMAAQPSDREVASAIAARLALST